MHELAIAKNIKDIVEEQVKEHNEIKKVERIKLVIGNMHAVVPESLRFNFKLLCKDTPFENTLLDIKEIPVRGECNTCGKSFIMENHLFICHFCGSISISIKGGDEFFIESIIGEE